MISNRLRAAVEITRPGNSIFAAVAVGTACVLFGLGEDRWMEILAGALAGGLITAGANAVNDYFDLDIDAVNRPERPLPRGALSRFEALVVWGVVSLGGISLNVFLPLSAFLIAACAVVLLVAYSAWFKRQVLTGNLLVALMTGMAFMYAGVIAGNVGAAVMPAVFAFLVNFARELVKDVEDLAGDRAHAARTLAVVRGSRFTLALAAGALGALVIATVVPAAVGLYGVAYMVLVGFVDILLVSVAVLIVGPNAPTRLKHASRLLKVSMVLGLVAIVAGTS